MNNKSFDFKKFASNYSVVIAFSILFLLSFLLNGTKFLNTRNILNLFLNYSIIGIIALGMTLIIITGGIDLSVGSQLAASGLLAITVFNLTGNIIYTVISTILFGIASGFLTGILIAKWKIPAFIVTLGTMNIYRSVSQYFFNGGGVKVTGDTKDIFIGISNFRIGGSISIIIIYWIILTVLVAVFSSKTAKGRHIYAVGSNEKATILSGINAEKIKILTYIISGVLVAIASVIEASRLGSMNSASSGSSYEMDAIAAVVIGGTAMSGGRGSISGTFLGTLTLGLINNMMNLLGVPAFLVDAIKGGIIIGAVFLQKYFNVEKE